MGAVLAVTGYLVAAPTLVSAVGISFMFGWAFGILSLVLAKKYGNVPPQESPHNAQDNVSEEGTSLRVKAQARKEGFIKPGAELDMRKFKDVISKGSVFPPIVVDDDIEEVEEESKCRFRRVSL